MRIRDGSEKASLSELPLTSLLRLLLWAERPCFSTRALPIRSDPEVTRSLDTGPQKVMLNLLFLSARWHRWAQPLILSYIVCAVVSTINYLIEFEWALAVLSGGETAKQPAWVETVAQTPAQNSYPGSSFVISFSAGIYWNDGSNIVVYAHLWAGLLIPHWIEHKIKMAAREWGLLLKKCSRQAESAVDVATGPGPVGRRISPESELHPRVSHFACQRSTWWHHFCGQLSVQPPFLSPPLSGSL